MYITKQKCKFSFPENEKFLSFCLWPGMYSKLIGHQCMYRSFYKPDSEIPSLTHPFASGDPLGGKAVQFGKITAK